MRSLRFLAFASALALLAPLRAEAAICGLKCPAGEHAQAFSFDRNCCPSPGKCNPTFNNQVSCAKNTPPSFNQCGTVCPSGFHPFQLNAPISCCTCTSCASCDGNLRNEAFCIVNSGQFFESCGGTCPADFSVSRRFFKFRCCTNSISSTCVPQTNNTVICQKV
jgi:hypothetical protein